MRLKLTVPPSLRLLLEKVGPELRQRLLARGPAIEEITHQRRGTGGSMNREVWGSKSTSYGRSSWACESRLFTLFCGPSLADGMKYAAEAN